MAWIAVNYNGQEIIFPGQPFRDLKEWSYMKNRQVESMDYDDYTEIELPKGTIKKLIGHELTWQDEPVELK